MPKFKTKNMTRYLSKVTNKTLTKGREYNIVRKEKLTIYILNDDKKIEKFEKKELKNFFDV